MSAHHQGAIDRAYDALTKAGDPPLKLMSYSIGYEQRGEINLMRGTVPGLPAVQERKPSPPFARQERPDF
jgi:uncharacterized protein (DUF305 family)